MSAAVVASGRKVRPRPERAVDPAPVEAGALALAGNPDRQVAPGRDLLRLQEVGRDPGQARVARRRRGDAGEHVAHDQRPGRPGGVEDARRARLGHADRPLGEVARVDELHRIAAVAGRQHLAAARQAHRPVGEAIGLVARADDQARPDDRRRLAELPLRLGFARRLQRPVELGLGAQRLDRLGHRVVAGVAQQRPPPRRRACRWRRRPRSSR